MNERCAACGMAVADGEYHPHAACVMYGASRDEGMVRANLAAVAKMGARAQREADAALVRAAGCIGCKVNAGLIVRDAVEIGEHDPNCPVTLAAAILEGKP